MEANLARYGRLQLAVAASFVWLPTSFLFFIEEYGLADAVRLQGIYYLAVVVAEVPSGWFSDRVGRVATLRMVAGWWIVANLLFLGSGQFATVAAAQIALALGFAFLSGTDVTFHYDTLEALDEADSFAERESAVQRNALWLRAAAVVGGGALGMIDLRIPFALALVAVVALGLIALRLDEPPRAARRERLGRDLGDAIGAFRQRILAWILVYVVAEVVLAHLASEFAAPYLADVLGEDLRDVDRASLFSGLLAAGVALGGAAVVRQAPRLKQRLGVVNALTSISVIPVVLVVAMATVTSWWVVALLALRMVQPAIGAVLVSETVGDYVEQTRRATVLSMTSLAGRLAYGAVLFGLSAAADFTTTLRWAAVIAFAALATVWLTSLAVVDDRPS